MHGWPRASRLATPNAQPLFAVFDETEQYFRDHPKSDYGFSPVGFNASKVGTLVCIRLAANLPKEADQEGERSGTPGSSSWAVVVWRDRKCPKWVQYEPGVAPREQLAEERSRKFALQIKSVESRLTWAAIIFGAIIGLTQIVAAALAITPDAMGCQLVKDVGGWFGALQWLTCK